MARQLAAPTDSQPLPQAPGHLSPELLRGGSAPEAPTPMPDRADAVQAAGQAILQDAIRRGQGVVKAPKKKRGGMLFAAAALLFLGAVGYLGWIKREPLTEAITTWLDERAGKTENASQPAEPSPVATVEPRPGIDPLPSAKEKAPKTPDLAVTTKVDSNQPEKAPTPAPGPIIKSAMVTEELPEPKMSEDLPQETAPALPARPKPEIARVEPSTGLPPKAMVVDDEPAPVKAIPVDPTKPATTGTSTVDNALVEVGHASPVEMKKTITSAQAKSEHVAAENGKPKISTVPDGAQEGLAGLLSFLKAPNWNERLKFTMLADQVREKGQIYYQTNSDGPIDVDEIHYLRHDSDPEVGSGTHCVFVLFSRAWEDGQHGIPVMVEVNKGMAQVDWLTFIEFKDNMLRQFMANPGIEGRWRFHVSMRRCHYFDDDVPNASTKDCFEIAPPMPGSSDLYAFTETGSQLSRSLANTITWDKRVTWGIVELQWRNDDGKSWVELTSVPQLNWYSAPAEIDTSKAPTIKASEPVKETRSVIPGSR
ncbi:MAG: hypothetical protein JNJ83_23880 [Verrucomicrobiaceae bacterium]|nr:hypothetical protein [Verrucomicrobiaceae bacterium]